jgi:hypothetical protein
MTKLASPNFSSLFVGADIRQRDLDMASILDSFATNLVAILDGGISFVDNVDVSGISAVTHVTPGTEFATAHALGKVPTGYIVVGQTAAGNVYDGTTANTTTTLYLKSDVSSKTFRILVF